MTKNIKTIDEFAKYLVESYFDGAVNVEEKNPLDEIKWDEPDIAGSSTRCLSIQQVSDFLNSEIERSKSGGRADPTMPRVALKVILGKTNKPISVMDFARLLSMPPKTIFDKGEKSLHTIDEHISTINTGIPALRGIVWDQENNEFRVINTCPGAGKCSLECYSLQGFYIMNSGKNLKLAQRLQMIFENPEGYFNQAFLEAETYAFQANRENKLLEIRWNDAGDFFSERYLKLAFRVTKALLEKNYKVKSYFYTKVGKMVELGKQLGFTVTFSQGGVQSIKHVDKQSIIVPSKLVSDFFTRTKGRGYEKDEFGKTKFRDDHAKDNLRNVIVSTYSHDTSIPDSNLINVNNTIYTDELPKIEGKPGEFNVIILPGGDSDRPAQREDVRFIFLIKH